MSKGKDLVSVVIPTYNSAKTISQCLESIRSQDYGPIEIILVDNFSKDGTRQTAKSFGCIIIEKRSERSQAKNYGIAKASGKYIMFIDSDMVLDSDLIGECVRTMNRSDNLSGLIIPERSIGTSFWVKVRDFERSFYDDSFVESARFFRTEPVKKVKGFDNKVIIFEEATIQDRLEILGLNNYSRTKAKISHLEYDFSLFKWLRKKYYYGQSLSIYSKKYKKYAKKQFSPAYRLSLFLGSKRFYSKPILAVGVILLKFLEYLSVLMGKYGVSSK